MSFRKAIFIGIITIGLLSSRAFARETEPVGVLQRAPHTILREDPYVRECELGSAVADAVRACAGTDVALVNVGDLENDLNDGVVTRSDVERVFAQDRPLAVAEITYEELCGLLEHAVSHVTVDRETEQIVAEESRFDGFCQVSGIRFSYDVTAPVGERVLSVTGEDGSELSGTVTLCAAAYMLEGGYGFEPADHELMDVTLADALEAYVRDHTSFPGSQRERITVIGIRVPFLGTGISRWTLLAGCVLLIAVLAVYRMKNKKYQEEYGRTEEESDIEKYVRASFRRDGK